MRETLVRAALWLFGLCFAFYTLQWFAITAWLPTFLIETQGRSAAGAATWGAMVVAANALGNFAAAWLMHRRVPRWLLIGIAFCAMGGSSAGIFLAGTPGELKIVLAFVFSAVGGLLPAAAICRCCRPRAARRLRRHGERLRGAGCGDRQPARPAR